MKGCGFSAPGLRRDAGTKTEIAEQQSKGVTVVGLVGEDRPAALSLEEFGRRGDVVPVASAKNDSYGEAEAIDEGMDLRVRATSGCSNFLTSSASRWGSILLAGTAGLVAGATSMEGWITSRRAGSRGKD